MKYFSSGLNNVSSASEAKEIIRTWAAENAAYALSDYEYEGLDELESYQYPGVLALMVEGNVVKHKYYFGMKVALDRSAHTPKIEGEIAISGLQEFLADDGVNSYMKLEAEACQKRKSVSLSDWDVWTEGRYSALLPIVEVYNNYNPSFPFRTPNTLAEILENKKRPRCPSSKFAEGLQSYLRR
jgi:hypothetical protein